MSAPFRSPLRTRIRQDPHSAKREHFSVYIRTLLIMNASMADASRGQTVIPMTAAADRSAGGHRLQGMVEPMDSPRLSRSERKQLTRQALVDGTLELLADRDFAGLSLRETARAAGIVPTAFYRHFDSLDDLGVALVEESMRPVRSGVRDLRRTAEGHPTVASACALVSALVADHPLRLGFLLREQRGGTAEIRRAIEAELRLVTGELAIDLARIDRLAAWAAADIDTVAGLLVTSAIDGAAELLDAGRPDSAAHREAVDRLRLRLRIVAAGAAALPPPGD